MEIRKLYRVCRKQENLQKAKTTKPNKSKNDQTKQKAKIKLTKSKTTNLNKSNNNKKLTYSKNSFWSKMFPHVSVYETSKKLWFMFKKRSRI